MAGASRILSAALVSGSVASIVSAAALALLAKAEGQLAARPINATSHWWHGERAASAPSLDVRHTGLGYATHHASSLLWAVLFEALRRRDRQTDVVSVARDATLVSAAAAVLDYGLIPRRLTPGWELVLSKRSVAAGLGAVAVGLTLGGLITRHMNGHYDRPGNARTRAGNAFRTKPVAQGAG